MFAGSRSAGPTARRRFTSAWDVLARSSNRAIAARAFPTKWPPDELTVEKALEMLVSASQAEEPLGVCPETGKPVYLKVGRFGPYVQRGNADDDEKPQNASLMKGMRPEDVDLAMAVKLLSLPRRLGEHPQTTDAVEAYNGRYGPYVKSGDETRSLSEGLSPLDVTLEQALELLAQPKVGRRGAAKSKEPLKVFAVSPVTGQPVELREGRYGPYVTDGQTNASLPKSMPPEELTVQMALDLLKARAEKGPSQKSTRSRTSRGGAEKAIFGRQWSGEGGRQTQDQESGSETEQEKELSGAVFVLCPFSGCATASPKQCFPGCSCRNASTK